MANPSGALERSSIWNAWNLFNAPAKTISSSKTAIDVSEVAQTVLKEQPLISQRNKLDLKFCCDLQAGNQFAFLCQHVLNIASLNLFKSNISDVGLQKGLPFLAFNSPNLEKLSLSTMTYNRDTLAQYLKAFPRLKELNVDCLYLGSMRDEDFAMLIISWIKANPILESFKCPQNSFSRQHLIDLFASFPSTLQTLSIGFNPSEFTKSDFINTMQTLSAKCGSTLKNLRIGIWTNSNLLDDETIAILPKLFPNLERLDLECNGQVSGDGAFKTLMQWTNLKVLNLLIAYPCKVEQYSALLEKFKNIEKFAPGTSCEESQMEVIAPILVQNSGKTLKEVGLNYIFNSQEEDKGLKALVPVLPMLKKIDFLWHQMNDQNFHLITNNLGVGIKSFYAEATDGDTNLTCDGLTAGFLKLSENCPYLEELGLAGHIFDIIDQPEAIQKVPYAFKNLRVLDLTNLKGMFDPNILLGFIETNLNLKIIDATGLSGDFKSFELSHPEIAERGIRIIYSK